MLARTVYAVTGGNAGKLHSLLDRWHHEQKLYFDEEQHRWAWDLKYISNTDMDRAIQERMLAKGRERLSDEEKKLVSIAAFIGSPFELSILSDVYEQSEDKVLGLLSAAERESWICEIDQQEETVKFIFLDEFICHAMAKEFERDASKWHLKIGQRILQRNKENGHKHFTQDAMRHLRLGSSEMSESDRYELVKEHFEVGRKCYDLY